MSEPAPFPDLSEAVLRAIIAEHGLHVSEISRLRSTGIVNSIYAFGDEFVLRVPKNAPEALSDTFTESVAAPTAWRAGVRTPRLIVFDETRTLLDVPYSIYERVHGETLGQWEEPAETAHAWVALGRDLAKLHGHCDNVMILSGGWAFRREWICKTNSNGWHPRASSFHRTLGGSTAGSRFWGIVSSQSQDVLHVQNSLPWNWKVR